jgi:hypothetical protein
VKRWDYEGISPPGGVSLTVRDQSEWYAMGRQTLAVEAPLENRLAAWLIARGVRWPFRSAADVQFVNVETGRVVGHFPTGWEAGFYAHRPLMAVFSQDDQLFAASFDRGSHTSIQIWDVPPRPALSVVLLVAALLVLPIVLLARWRVRLQPVYNAP